MSFVRVARPFRGGLNARGAVKEELRFFFSFVISSQTSFLFVCFEFTLFLLCFHDTAASLVRSRSVRRGQGRIVRHAGPDAWRKPCQHVDDTCGATRVWACCVRRHTLSGRAGQQDVQGGRACAEQGGQGHGGGIDVKKQLVAARVRRHSPVPIKNAPAKKGSSWSICARQTDLW